MRRTMLFLALIFIVFVQNTSCFKRFPLRADPSEFILDTTRSDVCLFDGEEKKIGEQWHPVLTFPRRIEMVCILCTCVPPEDPIYAYYYYYDTESTPKVDCRNVKDECPVLNCKDELVESDPKQCCKRCRDPDEADSASKHSKTQQDSSVRNDDSNAATVLDFDDKLMELQRTFKYFTAILTGSNLWPRRHTGALARVSFSFEQATRTLHFTASMIGISGAPTQLIFADSSTDKILHRHISDEASANERICGSWDDIPDGVLAKFDHNLVYVTLHTSEYEDGEIKGPIRSHQVLLVEAFSGMLAPVSDPGLSSGGLVFSNLRTHEENTVELVIALQGVTDYFLNDVPVEVELFDRSFNVIGRFQETLAPKESDWSVISTTWQHDAVSSDLSRGRISVRVSLGPEGSQRVVYNGGLAPKTNCDDFHAILTGSEEEKGTGAAGSAFLAIQHDFSISYEIHVLGFSGRDNTVEFCSVNDEVQPPIQMDISYTYFDNWAVGFISNPSAQFLQALVLNQVHIKISSRESGSDLLGKVVRLHHSETVSGAMDERGALILAGSAVVPKVYTRAAGHAWLRLDQYCNLHYEIAVGGFDAHEQRMFEMGRTVTEAILKADYELASTDAEVVRGVVTKISADFFEYMNIGKAYLQVKTKQQPNGEIRAKFSLSNDCMHRDPSEFSFGDDGSAAEDESSKTESHSVETEPNLAEDPKSCYSEDEYRAHKAHWLPEFDKTCTVCRCEASTVICEPRYTCQYPTECDNYIIKPGECCYSCPEGQAAKNSSSGCMHNEERHEVGDVWNPVVHPFGVIKCAECTCSGDNQVSCSRVQCPEPTCQHPIKKNPTDCCAVCVEEEEEVQVSENTGDSPPQMLNDGILVSNTFSEPKPCFLGEFIYEDGQSFNPIVAPFGKQLCVDCLCMAGKLSCSRIQCEPITDCPKQFIRTYDDQCCPVCLAFNDEVFKTNYEDFVLLA
uniref:Chordin/sog n=1 Tax=Isodiametra pulchra TaxID=504439 RepID=A0A2P1DV63_ISOPU|nr:chordin/sog [Isodiametra pulchra]